MSIVENKVTIFGFIRILKVTCLVFIIIDLVNNLTSFKNKIIQRVHKRLERQTTLNIEKILEILNEMKGRVSDNDTINIEFIIDTISNNKLFVPQLFDKIDKNEDIHLKQEIAFWVQNFEKVEKIVNVEDELLLRDNMNDSPRKIIDELRQNEMQNVNERFSTFFDSDQSNKIVQSLTNIYSLDFNVFQLREASNSQELLALMYYLFYRHDYFSFFNIRTQKFINFAKRVQSLYHNNYYHNATHAADVMQVIYTYK
jgi:hypothetical protein